MEKILNFNGQKTTLIRRKWTKIEYVISFDIELELDSWLK